VTDYSQALAEQTAILKEIRDLLKAQHGTPHIKIDSKLPKIDDLLRDDDGYRPNLNNAGM